jgi:hypothetical protein
MNKRGMLENLIWIIAVAFIFSCNKKKNDRVLDGARKENAKITVTTTQPKVVYSPDQKYMRGIHHVNMSLGDSLGSARSLLRENLYGRFFYNRAEYYIVEMPTVNLMGSEVYRATLFYFDHELCKIKYWAARDLTPRIINGIKEFSIRGLDNDRRTILKSYPAIFKISDKSYILHPGVIDFEIKWQNNDKLFVWTCIKSKGMYEYSEIYPNYFKKFRELEIYDPEISFK